MAAGYEVFGQRDSIVMSDESEIKRDRIGTKQSAIARLEDAEYEGHSLLMMNRTYPGTLESILKKIKELEVFSLPAPFANGCSPKC